MSVRVTTSEGVYQFPDLKSANAFRDAAGIPQQKEGLFHSLTKNFVRAGKTVAKLGQGIASLSQGPEARARFNQSVVDNPDLLNTPEKAIGAGLDIGTTIGGGEIAGLAGKTLARAGLKAAIKQSIGFGILSGALSGAGSAASDQQFRDTGASQIGQGAIGGAIGGAITPLSIKAGKAVQSFTTQTIPKRFFSTFFKTTADDLGKEIRTRGIQTIQQQNPELYGELVKKGIVKATTSGKVVVNPTLAEEAISKGFGTGKTGRSLEKMAEYSVIKQLELEKAAQDIVGQSVVSKSGVAKTTSRLGANKFWVDLGNRKNSYIQMLQSLRQNFSEQGFGSKGFLSNEVSQVDQMLGQLQRSKGKSIPADTALNLRRLIDGLRNSTSFRSNPNLTLKQGSFKEGADFLRSKLSQIPELQDVMKQYSFYIKAANDLTEEAAKRGNQRIFTLFDAVVGGSSIGANTPEGGLSLLALLRTVQTPQVLLGMGQTLSHAGPIFKTTQSLTNPLFVPIGQKVFNRQ